MHVLVSVLRTALTSLACSDLDLTEPAQRSRCAQELLQHVPLREGPAAFDLHDIIGQVCNLFCGHAVIAHVATYTFWSPYMSLL